LHDLCVQLEAASPGELKSGGAGLSIKAGFSESPFGICLIAETSRGICHLSFVETGKNSAAWNVLKEEWPNAKIARDDKHAAKLAKRIFTHASGKIPLRAFVARHAFSNQCVAGFTQNPFWQLDHLWKSRCGA